MEAFVSTQTSMTREKYMKKILNCVQKSVQTFYIIVDSLGFDTAEESKWQEEFYNFIEGTVNEATACAQERLNTLRDKIDNLLKESRRMCNLLNIQMPQVESRHQDLFHVEHFLIEKVNGWRDEVSRRMDEIIQLKLRRDAVCQTLHRQPFDILESPLPTSEVLDSYVEKIEILEMEKQQRLIKYDQIQKKIAALASEIQYATLLDFERHIISGDERYIDLSDANIQRVTEFHRNLIVRRDMIQDQLAMLREKLQHLWRILEEDVQYCNDFIRDHVGLNLNTLEAFKYEIRQCEDIRKTKLPKCIVTLREELKSLWQRAAYSPARREPFMRYMEDNLYTEDLLTLHDKEIERVKTFLSNNGKIFELLEQHNGFYNRIYSLEERENAPDRFKNRGGKLLKEERERKTIIKKISAVERQLLVLGAAYEEEHGEKFTIWEDTIEDMIAKSKQFTVQPRRTKSKRSPLSKSPSATSLLSNTNMHTTSQLKTPVTRRNLPYTASVKRVINSTTTNSSTRPSIAKAKAKLSRSADKRSMDKRKAALRASVDYANFQNNVTKRSSMAERPGNIIPIICVETPRTVDRKLKITSSKGFIFEQQ